MPHKDATVDAFRTYATLIEAMLPQQSGFRPEAETALAVQVERGLIYPICLRKPQASGSDLVERLIELSRLGGIDHLAVVDRQSHHRPFFRPLLVYAWLQAFRLSYETLARPEFGRWEEASRVWCDLLEAELTSIRSDEASSSAARGASIAELAWSALALSVAGKVFIRDAWTDLAADAFGRLIRTQDASGAFLRATASDNPETHWYHELVILHAASSYAVQNEDRFIASAVQRNTEFHLNQTQPDHATAHPFAVFAFAWNPRTRPMAEGLLHGVQTLQPGGVTGLAAILLADALHGFRLFL